MNNSHTSQHLKELRLVLTHAFYLAGKGVIWYLGKILVVMFFLGLLIQEGANLLEIGWDSTDGKSRSGMSLHIDAATNCQYLSTATGGITPRLTPQGSHMGCKNQR